MPKSRADSLPVSPTARSPTRALPQRPSPGRPTGNVGSIPGRATPGCRTARLIAAGHGHSVGRGHQPCAEAGPQHLEEREQKASRLSLANCFQRRSSLVLYRFQRDRVALRPGRSGPRALRGSVPPGSCRGRCRQRGGEPRHRNSTAALSHTPIGTSSRMTKLPLCRSASRWTRRSRKSPRNVHKQTRTWPKGAASQHRGCRAFACLASFFEPALRPKREHRVLTSGCGLRPRRMSALLEHSKLLQKPRGWLQSLFFALNSQFRADLAQLLLSDHRILSKSPRTSAVSRRAHPQALLRTERRHGSPSTRVLSGPPAIEQLAILPGTRESLQRKRVPHRTAIEVAALGGQLDGPVRAP